MSHWGVQIVIGRLLTDSSFRQRFVTHSHECLVEMRKRGIGLDAAETAALTEADAGMWSRMAARIDRRLQYRGLRAGRREASQRPLTPRELQVLTGVYEGLTNKQIGAEVGASEAAIKSTLQHLFRKTHVRTRAQLVRVALERGLGDVATSGSPASSTPPSSPSR